MRRGKRRRARPSCTGCTGYIAPRPRARRKAPCKSVRCAFPGRFAGTAAAESGMTNSKLLSAALALAIAAGGATFGTGCREKGPAERAGEKVDKTMDKIEDKL